MMISLFLYRETESQDLGQGLYPESPIVLAVPDTEFDRDFCVFHLDEIVDVGFEDGIVVTTIEHPTHGTQFFDLLGSGMAQIFYR